MAEVLSDHANIVMGQSPQSSDCNVTGSGLPLLNGPTEFGPTFPIPVQFTTDPRKLAETGDLLFCVRGSTTGRMNWADRRYAIGRGLASIKHKTDKRLNSLVRAIVEWQLPALLIAATGSTFPNVSSRQLADLTWPESLNGHELSISNVFSAIDDKIELNLQAIKSLERMVHAIFKDWFVDFGPVLRKQAGITDAIAIMGGFTDDHALASKFSAQFPDDFGEGGLPMQWKIKSIEEIVDRISVGKKYEQKTVNLTGLVPVLDQGKTGIIGYHSGQPGVFASEENPIVVFANHTCYMRLIHFPFSAIQNVLPFVGRGVNTIWAYYATLGKQNFIEYKGHWPDFVAHEVVVPNTSLTDEFAGLVGPFLQLSRSHEAANRTLVETRRYLIPKLISGELRAHDAEHSLEGAAL